MWPFRKKDSSKQNAIDKLYCALLNCSRSDPHEHAVNYKTASGEHRHLTLNCLDARNADIKTQRALARLRKSRGEATQIR